MPRPRLLRPPLALALCAALAVPAAAPSAAAASCAGANAHPSDASLKRIQRATHCLINQRRADQGRPTLRHNSKLRRASKRHSRSMVEDRFFSHTSPGGATVTDRVKRTGYLSGSTSWALGENIGWGSGSNATPREMVRAWMKSDGHRANILRREFRHVGVGVVSGAPLAGVERAATYTTDFGRN